MSHVTQKETVVLGSKPSVEIKQTQLVPQGFKLYHFNYIILFKKYSSDVKGECHGEFASF